jgi:hypothetical protein
MGDLTNKISDIAKVLFEVNSFLFGVEQLFPSDPILLCSVIM